MQHDSRLGTKSQTTSVWMKTEGRLTSNWLDFTCCALLFVAHMSAAAFALKALVEMLVT
jgi:hypothetical protein